MATAIDTSFYGNDFSEDSNADVASLIQMVLTCLGWSNRRRRSRIPYFRSGSLYLASLASNGLIINREQAWDGTRRILDGWPRQLEDVHFLQHLPSPILVVTDNQMSSQYLVDFWLMHGKTMEANLKDGQTCRGLDISSSYCWRYHRRWLSWRCCNNTRRQSFRMEHQRACRPENWMDSITMMHKIQGIMRHLYPSKMVLNLLKDQKNQAVAAKKVPLMQLGYYCQ